MSEAHPGFHGTPALVPGVLRGYRRFRLTSTGLHPTVHYAGGPWSGQLEKATCTAGRAHRPPAPDCGCGLYGWFHPTGARADSGFGDVTAVIAAQGRIVLGDHGFRAEAARVEAVALSPGPHRGARRMLARQYPLVAVYRSRRTMLRHYPPADLSALGITVRPSSASRYRRTALLVWLAGVIALYSIVVLPQDAVTDLPTAAWLGALVVFVGWQAVLVWLVVRSSTTTPRRASGAGPRPGRPG